MMWGDVALPWLGTLLTVTSQVGLQVLLYALLWRWEAEGRWEVEGRWGVEGRWRGGGERWRGRWGE